MNQLVPFHSGQAPVLIAAAGEHARVRFIEFFTAKSAIGAVVKDGAPPRAPQLSGPGQRRPPLR